jgi:hypothetical protein
MDSWGDFLLSILFLISRTLDMWPRLMMNAILLRVFFLIED